jgi:hypothetical protein
VSVALKLNADAKTATVRFQVNGTVDAEQTLPEAYYYLDATTDRQSYIGAKRKASAEFEEPFHGFIYSLYIDNTYIAGKPTYYTE